MLKLAGRARGHFVTLIETRVHKNSETEIKQCPG